MISIKFKLFPPTLAYILSSPQETASTEGFNCHYTKEVSIVPLHSRQASKKKSFNHSILVNVDPNAQYHVVNLIASYYS